MRYIFSILLLFMFSGCDYDSIFGPSKDELALKNKEFEAKIEMQKNELNAKKELELAKINNALKKEAILVKKDEIKSKNLELNSQNELIKLSIIAGTIVILTIFVALYFYFSNKRKDKLRAYEDNLDKYFKQKDRDAKIQIANKIIDTIATGKLSKNQETKLLMAISEEKISEEIETEVNNISNENDDEILQLEFSENDSKIEKEEKPKKEKKAKKEKKKKEKKKKKKQS